MVRSSGRTSATTRKGTAVVVVVGAGARAPKLGRSTLPQPANARASARASTVAAQGAALTQRLATTPGISQSVSYWTLGSPPPLRSNDNRQALVLARIAGNDDQVRDRIKVLSPQLKQDTPLTSVGVGGFAEI